MDIALLQDKREALVRYAIEQGQMPRYLYKYWSTSSVIRFLGNHKIMFSQYTDFNDPFECAANIDANNSAIEWADYLASQGFNEAAICGILANIRKETNFRSDIGGDYGTSYGMCGWHATRWDRLKNYCDKNNLDIRTIETQSQFLVWELKNCYSGLYKTLKSIPNTAQGAYEAAYQFTIHFERPQGMYDKGVERGNIAAGDYYPFYTS